MPDSAPAPGVPGSRNRSRIPPLAAALALVALLAGSFGYGLADRDDDAARAGNALVVGLERVLSAVKDVETGQRGYLLVGREDYLEPYAAGRVAAEEGMRAVEALRHGSGHPSD